MYYQSMTEASGLRFHGRWRYPDMGFSGPAVGRRPRLGNVTMPGQKHPMDIDLHTADGRMTATPMMPRAGGGDNAEPVQGRSDHPDPRQLPF